MVRNINVAWFTRAWGFINLINKLGSGYTTLSLALHCTTSASDRLPLKWLLLTFRELCGGLSFNVECRNILTFGEWIQSIFGILRRGFRWAGWGFLFFDLFNLSISLPFKYVSSILVQAKPHTLPTTTRILSHIHRFSIFRGYLFVHFYATYSRLLFICSFAVLNTASVDKVGQWLPGIFIKLTLSLFKSQFDEFSIS